MTNTYMAPGKQLELRAKHTDPVRLHLQGLAHFDTAIDVRQQPVARQGLHHVKGAGGRVDEMAIALQGCGSGSDDHLAGIAADQYVIVAGHDALDFIDAADHRDIEGTSDHRCVGIDTALAGNDPARGLPDQHCRSGGQFTRA